FFFIGFGASIKIPLPLSFTLGVSIGVSESNSSSGSLITTPFLLLVGTTGAAKAAKRRKLYEQAKEDKDLKKQLEVVDDEDDDVFIKATPIGRKVPVVDYEIVMINNKPRYKIIKTMFEKTDGQDAIWRNQQSVYGQALVLILLVEKRYLLSKFTLEQLVNVVRLKVEEESEMSLELLRFTRQ
nr:hypothetical protein [Tanacetum cinerariifolium]